MSSTVPAIALSIAVIAAIIGALFYRDDIRKELKRKSRPGYWPGNVIGPDSGGGGHCDGGDAGGAGGDGGSP